MKKAIIISIVFMGIWLNNPAQNSISKNLLNDLMQPQNDSLRMQTLHDLSDYYKFIRPDSAILFANTANKLARELEDPENELWSIIYLVLAELTLGNDSEALQNVLRGLKIAEKNNLMDLKARLLIQMGVIYTNSEEYDTALNYFKEAKAIFDTIQNYTFSTFVKLHIGETFLFLNKPDSALYYSATKYNEKLVQKWVNQYYLYNLGKVYHKIGNPELALSNYQMALHNAASGNEFFNPSFSMAQLYQETDNPDSCLYYAKKAFNSAMESGIHKNIIAVNTFLSEYYETIDIEQALNYSKTARVWQDNLTSIGKISAIKSMTASDEKEREYELERARTEFKNRLRRNAFLGSTFTLIVIAIFFFILGRRKQKSNALLKRQKAKVEETLEQLKSTQSQLIQSEKMASLGELTAGIAHEIRNPLNFINNFSEVSNELVEEVKSEKAKGKNERDEDLENELLEDISQNLKKITHHGKSAEAIINGMLQHSRTNSGEKELTDINKLADEYLRLSYHGLRAKDKSFNADFKLVADKSLPKVNVIPQDIGRVLLNLINNAFYACTERSRSTVDKKANAYADKYKPLVSVTTSLESSSFGKPGGKSLQIVVKDNGSGISPKIKDKIFQPFFTTKPTGSGTGLGLSLSYDIVKAHGGKIKVESSENKGTTFTISLPQIQ